MLIRDLPTPPYTQSDAAAAHRALRHAPDLDSLWRSCVDVFDASLPYAACELFFDFEGFKPRRALQNVRAPNPSSAQPPVSLSVAGPFLARHPRRQIYSYSQILRNDPGARRRRQLQIQGCRWNEFVQSAFWRDDQLDTVLSVACSDKDQTFSRQATELLQDIYRDVDDSLQRLRALDAERQRHVTLECLLDCLPSAVLLISADGRVLFGNDMARQACRRWNEGLPDPAWQLQADSGALFAPHPLPSLESLRARGAATIRHPQIATLSLRVSAQTQTARPDMCNCHLVELVDVKALRTDAAPQDTVSDTASHGTYLQTLTPRERRVAQLVANGMRNEEIASKLCRSRRTIEFQVSSVYRKLGVSSRIQLSRLLSE
ncbi:helix-turn-helix transcriptional regulator [Luteimonas sp. RIT-PG2_3]